eukprot:3989203-Amphidinium_carterae.4
MTASERSVTKGDHSHGVSRIVSAVAAHVRRPPLADSRWGQGEQCNLVVLRHHPNLHPVGPA